MLAERRRGEEARKAFMRVKVATVTAKKPKQRRKINFLKCRGQAKPATNLDYVQQQGKVKSNNRLYMRRFGQFRKPQRLLGKRRDGDYVGKPKEQIDIASVPTAPPPPPGCGESLWEQPNKDMPNLVAFAHEVFNRPLHLRKRQASFCDNLYVSDFIPLENPITDAAGGAISKRHRLLGRPLCSRYSRPLPPLSHVLSGILAKQMVRAKGGGLSQKAEEAKDSYVASQFPPIDSYEGPSEDALVVESAQQMLRQPKALHIKKRTDLPTTRLSSFESEPSSDCSSSPPFDMPMAQPVERPCHSYNMGAPLRLHEMMKAVAQSGLSDSSASSSSSGSSSQRSVSSTLPVVQQTVSSRGGKEPLYEENPDELKQKPTADCDPTEADKFDSSQIKDNQSVKVILHFIERLHIEGSNNDDTPSTLKKKVMEEELNTNVGTLKELQHSYDMSNELPLKFVNKSAGNAKYVNGQRLVMTNNVGTTNSTCNASTPMCSIISRFFTSKCSNGRHSRTDSNRSDEEMKPLSIPNLHYGSIHQHHRREDLHTSLDKISINRIMQAKTSNSNCQKCGHIRVTTDKTKKYCRFYLESLSSASSYHTSKANKKILNPTKIAKNFPESLMTKQNTRESLESKMLQSFKTKKQSFNKFQDSQNISYDTMLQIQAEDNSYRSTTRSEDLLNFKGRRKILNRKTKTNMTDAFKRCQYIENIKGFKNDHRRDKRYIVQCPKRSEHIQNFKAPKTIQRKFNNDINETATSSLIIKSETHKIIPGPLRRDIQLKELLEKLRQRQPKFSASSHVVKILETLSFQSSKIFQPKMVFSARQLMNYILKLMNLNKPFGLLEFRTPDVRKFESNKTQANKCELFKHSAQFKSCHQSEESLVSDNKKLSSKRHQRTVWPALPFRYKKPKLYYKVDNKYTENYNIQTKHTCHEENDRWLANEFVQKKIQEMWKKPIKLLSLKEGKALETL